MQVVTVSILGHKADVAFMVLSNDWAQLRSFQTAVAASGPVNEWDSLFGDEELESKFQDGHYVYTVVAGGGTGNDVYPPTIYVADVESAVDFNNVLMP